MKTYKKIFTAICILTAAVACSDWGTREIFEGSALGVIPDSTSKTKVFVLPETECKLHIGVISNQEYAILNDAEWISAPTSSRNKEGFDISCPANDGVARLANIILAIEETAHYDTLTIKQKGMIHPAISFKQTTYTFNGSAAGKADIEMNYNIPENEIKSDVEYLSSTTDWIHNVAIKDGKLTFDYPANPNMKKRSASIALSFTDGWGEITTAKIYILQLNAADSEGTVKTIAELKELGTEEGFVIDSDIIIEGIVVSNKNNGNAGDNPQEDELSIDYSVSERTIYLESLDASHGIRLETVSSEDNKFNQGDILTLNLSEATLHKSAVTDPEKDPVYYYVNNVNYGMVIKHEAGSKDAIPVKEKTIGTLTDDDIFTYVTLKDCELPVRKGSLTPINEEFTNISKSEKCAKFAILLRDIDGNSMYVYTNTTCPYRRDGSVLPYGSGSMSGVIVHEHYTRFEFQDTDSINEDTYGNIGRYQIRHTDKKDFGMAATMKDNSFSEILCEWRYALGQYQDKYDATDGDLNAYFISSFFYDKNNASYIEDGRAGKLAYTLYNDFSYLGPMDAAGNINGVGICLEDGTWWMSPQYSGANSQYAEGINSAGTGVVPTGSGSAWCTNITRFQKAPQYMKIIFSTQNISTNKLSLQVAMMNDYFQTTSKVPGPRFWHLDYSLTDKNDWTRLETFTVPDYLQSNIPQIWQTAGFKQMDFPLPVELCGKETVYLRLIPDESFAAGSRSLYIDPSSTTDANGSYRICWNYIGIRYNK